VVSADRWIVHGPAIATLETASIARGVVALDQMAKRAKTSIVAARSFSPGRYLILLSGPVGEVEEALAAGLDAALEDRVDDLILRDPAPLLIHALGETLEPGFDESLLFVETTTLSSALLALDRALKDAEVRPLELRLGSGLSGKGIFSLTGALHMIGAAEDSIRASIPEGKIVRIERIAQPHPDLPGHLLGAEGAFVRGPLLDKAR
jgi:microcompartment protein CcmL/EutN